MLDGTDSGISFEIGAGTTVSDSLRSVRLWRSAMWKKETQKSKTAKMTRHVRFEKS